MIKAMVFNTTFNSISVISWRSVSLVECPEKTTDIPHVTDKLYHMMWYRVHIAWAGFEPTTLVVIGTDCIVVVNPITIRSRPGRPQDC